MTALIGLRENLQLARLHLITDLRGGKDAFVEFVDMAFGAGADIIQVRDQGVDDATLVEALNAASRVAFDHLGLVCVGRRADVATQLQSDLLHLGASDGDLGDARGALHQWSLVGRSVHDEAQIRHAVDERADWAVVGPVFGDGAPGLDLVATAAATWPVTDEHATPWFAAGGITPDNLDGVLAAGATRIVVGRAVTTAADPRAVLQDFDTRLRAHWRQVNGEGYAHRTLGGPERTATLNETLDGPPEQ
ncbi:thiamine phosphate synthase [Propionibacteriaceae bacterium G1746]|uniref:thiamine phosphate synthase n=1 Tax=Aestuariimicrobium sp. G57 TaxID=3418485 RepID=UPI003C29440C